MNKNIIKYLITNPSKAVDATKKKVDKNLTFSIVIVEWILFAIAALLIRYNPVVSVGKYNPLISVGVFIGGVVVTLFAGLLVEVIYRTLGCKGGYMEGLSVIAYSSMPLAFGVFIASILFLGKLAGFVFGLAVLSIYGVMSVAELYYSAKTFFKTDMITAIIGTSVLMLGITMIIYTSAIGIAMIKTNTLSTSILTKAMTMP